MSEYTERDLINLGAAELARRFLIQERVRKHWRLIAIRISLGDWNIDAVKNAAFKEVLGIVPEDAWLDQELHAAVDALEAREGAPGFDKPLRKIILSNDHAKMDTG
jgi:hypothetical protein